MNENGYVPMPSDLTGVVLTDDLVRLTEILAENVHDVWSQGRMKEGWRYGEVKDEKKKLTPCLVSYNELPESENDFDRNTALETIKFIINAGFEITKKS